MSNPKPIPSIVLWRAFVNLSPSAFAYFLAAAHDQGETGARVTEPADVEALTAGLEPDGLPEYREPRIEGMI